VTGTARALIGGGLALAAVVAMGTLTRAEYTATAPGRAEIRLAWRARVPLVEECRRLTEPERAALPAHMRRELVCEGRVASYRLEVEVDGTIRHRSVVEGAGARGDRPLYVFETVAVAPGRHVVRVVFERIEEGAESVASGADFATGTGSDPEPESDPRRGRAPVPDRLVLETQVDLEGRDVLLVGYDAEVEELVATRG
jgi:hypothetical protein